MKVFAISDLHLSGMSDKPMDVFGPEWEGHFEKIRRDWLEKVKEEDVVLLGGDTSWGMKFEEGMFDVLSLADLPGEKVFVRGNHDFWWNGISRVRAAAPPRFHFRLREDRQARRRGVAGMDGPGERRFHRARYQALSAGGRAVQTCLQRGGEGARGRG